MRWSDGEQWTPDFYLVDEGPAIAATATIRQSLDNISKEFREAQLPSPILTRKRFKELAIAGSRLFGHLLSPMQGSTDTANDVRELLLSMPGQPPEIPTDGSLKMPPLPQLTIHTDGNVHVPWTLVFQPDANQ